MVAWCGTGLKIKEKICIKLSLYAGVVNCSRVKFLCIPAECRGRFPEVMLTVGSVIDLCLVVLNDAFMQRKASVYFLFAERL